MLQMAYEGKKNHKWVDVLFGKVCPLLDNETNKLMKIPPKPPNVIRVTIKYKFRNKRTKLSIEQKIYWVK